MEYNYSVKMITGGIGYPAGENLLRSKKVASTMSKYLKRYYAKDKIVLVGTGSSGLILSTFIASLMKNVIVIESIEKPGASNHHSTNHYINTDIYKVIIVDDFIKSGETIKRIWDVLIKDNDEVSFEVEALIVSETFATNQLFLEDVKVNRIFSEGIYPKKLKISNKKQNI